jgi:CRISPR/Cas system Type II protein with McrA/HNH and RuvC-like nuclease domain
MIFSTSLSLKRPTITSCRDALDGYQKGKCFYCFQDVSIESGHLKLADVDHFFPRQLFSECAQLTNLDGIWNLVLACKQCNRGSGGKSGQLPALDLLKRLHTRNTFLIESHHPLRETLLTQTGQSEAERINFLQSIDSFARERLVHRWSPIEEAEPVF